MKRININGQQSIYSKKLLKQKYKFLTSTVGSQCSCRNLDEKEKNQLILKTSTTCVDKEKYLLRSEMIDEKKILWLELDDKHCNRIFR